MLRRVAKYPENSVVPFLIYTNEHQGEFVFVIPDVPNWALSTTQKTGQVDNPSG